MTEFETWLASPDTRFVYHEGFLALDRKDEAIAEIAKPALRAAGYRWEDNSRWVLYHEHQKILLTQKKLADCRYRYIATKVQQ